MAVVPTNCVRTSIARVEEDGQSAMQFKLVFLVLFSLTARVAAGETVLLQGAAQGTTYHIKYVVPKDNAKAAAAEPERIRAEVEKLLDEIDRAMSTYRNDSELSRFNRAPAGEWFAVSPA